MILKDQIRFLRFAKGLNHMVQYEAYPLTSPSLDIWIKDIFLLGEFLTISWTERKDRDKECARPRELTVQRHQSQLTQTTHTF